MVLIITGVAGWRGYQYWEGGGRPRPERLSRPRQPWPSRTSTPRPRAAFAKIAAEALSGYRTLAACAPPRSRVRDPQAAVKLFDAIGSDSTVGQSEQDLAEDPRRVAAGRYRALYDEIRQRLEPVTAAGRAFRHTARDLLALSAWRANDMASHPAVEWIDH